MPVEWTAGLHVWHLISPSCYPVFQGVKYEFSYRHKKCIKKPLDREFQPWRVPKDAYYIGQAVLGASSGFGQGLLIDAWQGELSLGNLTGTLRIIRAAGEESKRNTCCTWPAVIFFFLSKNLLNQLCFSRQLVICLLPQQNTGILSPCRTAFLSPVSFTPISLDGWQWGQCINHFPKETTLPAVWSQQSLQVVWLRLHLCPTFQLLWRCHRNCGSWEVHPAKFLRGCKVGDAGPSPLLPLLWKKGLVRHS